MDERRLMRKHSRLPWESGTVPMAAAQQAAAHCQCAIFEQECITRHACVFMIMVPSCDARV